MKDKILDILKREFGTDISDYWLEKVTDEIIDQFNTKEDDKSLISVVEKIPDVGQPIIAFSPGKKEHNIAYMGSDYNFYKRDGNWRISGVTHWKPLHDLMVKYD